MSSKPKQIAQPGADRTIVLIGLMGAGKSAIGRRLAARMGLAFVDSDAEIELAAGCSIEDIFDLHSEVAFRDCERRVIARLLNDPPHVLATGGGAYMDPETRACIGEFAISIWLRADLDILLDRVSRRDNRPLLKHGDKRETLKRLIEERYPVYAQADITVESRDAPHETAVDIILHELTDYKGGASNASDQPKSIGRTSQ
jgi:shikimate kinase